MEANHTSVSHQGREGGVGTWFTRSDLMAFFARVDPTKRPETVSLAFTALERQAEALGLKVDCPLAVHTTKCGDYHRIESVGFLALRSEALLSVPGIGGPFAAMLVQFQNSLRDG